MFENPLTNRNPLQHIHHTTRWNFMFKEFIICSSGTLYYKIFQ